MKKYEVTVFQLARCTYAVEAVSMEEAIKQVNPDGHLIDQYVMDEFVDQYGMSFEEAEAIGIDTEIIRSEYNFDRNHGYVENLSSIREVKS